jgi:hypothetical protein
MSPHLTHHLQPKLKPAYLHMAYQKEKSAAEQRPSKEARDLGPTTCKTTAAENSNMKRKVLLVAVGGY